MLVKEHRGAEGRKDNREKVGRNKSHEYLATFGNEEKRLRSFSRRRWNEDVSSLSLSLSISSRIDGGMKTFLFTCSTVRDDGSLARRHGQKEYLPDLVARAGGRARVIRILINSTWHYVRNRR